MKVLYIHYFGSKKLPNFGHFESCFSQIRPIIAMLVLDRSDQGEHVTKAVEDETWLASAQEAT